MRLDHDRPGRLDDGALVRWLHGELPEEDRGAVQDHLGRCPACRARVDELEAELRRVREALRRTDAPPPTSGEWDEIRRRMRSSRTKGRRRRRIAAAVVALVGAGVLATPPVRAWVATQWERVTGAGEVSPALPGAPDVPDAVELGFAAPGPAVEVRVASVQDRGALEVRFGAEASARARVRGGGGEAMAVGSGALLIENRAGSGASYALTLPAGVERVVIHVADSEAVEVVRGRVGSDPVLVALDGSGRVRRRPLHDDERVEPGVRDVN